MTRKDKHISGVTSPKSTLDEDEEVETALPKAESPQSSETQPKRRADLLDHLARHPKGYEPWTDDEVELVLAMAIEGVGWEEISTRTGRSVGAIRGRASQLAFTRVYGAELPDQPTAARNGTPWTAADDGLLDALIGEPRSWAEIGVELERKPSSCRRRAEKAALDRLSGRTL